MDNKQKSLATNKVKKADAAADIDLINQYALKKLTPEDVFCFSVALCNNDIDRDFERFTDACLDKLAGLFLGKTGISDHSWLSKDQISRIYRCEVTTPGGKNSLGEPLRELTASAYMLRTDDTKKTIDAIEGGILKEVSVGCAIGTVSCSICGKKPYSEDCGHQRGEKYDEKLCYYELSDPQDAYEYSFVAVPAQPGAGVHKSYEPGDVEKAVEVLTTADLSKVTDKLPELINKAGLALLDAENRAKRAEIVRENEKYLKKEQ